MEQAGLNEDRDPRGKPPVPIRIPQASAGLAGQRLDRGGQAAEHAVNLAAQKCHTADADEGDEREQQAVLGQRCAFFTPDEFLEGGECLGHDVSPNT